MHECQMITKWYKILVQERCEMKTVQQLSMLNIKSHVPSQEVIINDKHIQQLTENNVVYAYVDEKELPRIQSLPFVKQITLCNIDPSSSPSKES